MLKPLTQWTWVWAGSGSWWWTGKPGVLQSMGSQRVGHYWATEVNWKLQWASRPFVANFILQLKFPNSYLNYFQFKPPVFQFSVDNSRILRRKMPPPQFELFFFFFLLKFIWKSYILFMFDFSISSSGKLSIKKKICSLLNHTRLFYLYALTKMLYSK